MRLDQQRQKHLSEIDELNDQIAQQTRVREQLERSKSSLEREKAELTKELESAHQFRTGSEMQRKQAEAKLMELQHSTNKYSLENGTLDQQLARVKLIKKF